jgi:hypothetical protein
MKRHYILSLCFIFVYVLIAPSQTAIPSHCNSKEALESNVNKIISDFNLYIKELGYNLPAMPKAKIQTEPSLIRLDKSNNAIIVPYWDDLLNDQKEIFKSWTGENAEKFFILMFNWFFIPHELGHFINPKIHDIDPYTSEKEANEVAVLFLKRNPENLEKLNFIKKSISQILGSLPKIEFGNMSEVDYFNTNYQKIGNDPNTYGYFQFKFILDALNNQKNISIRRYFDQVSK